MVERESSVIAPIGAPVARIAQNFGAVKNIPPPPLPIKKRNPKEASFSNTDFSLHSVDLSNKHGPIPQLPPGLGTVFSPSRKALNLQPQNDQRLSSIKENYLVANKQNNNEIVNEHPNLQKIYFGCMPKSIVSNKKISNPSTSSGNVENITNKMQFTNANHVNGNVHSYKSNLAPLVRNPTLSELLDGEIRSKSDTSSNPRSNQVTPEVPKLSESTSNRQIPPRSMIERRSRFDCSPTEMSSMEADSLQAIGENISSLRRLRTIDRLNKEQISATNEIQKLPLPDIPEKSTSKLASRTLLNLRHKQPVKAAVRIIENENETTSATKPPQIHVVRKQSISKPKENKQHRTDKVPSPKPREEYFQERYQHQSLIENDKKQSPTENQDQNRKRYKRFVENVKKKAPLVKGKTVIILYHVNFTITVLQVTSLQHNKIY